MEKHIYTEKYDEIPMQQFIIELNNLNIYEHLNQNIDSSPQANYEILLTLKICYIKFSSKQIRKT